MPRKKILVKEQKNEVKEIKPTLKKESFIYGVGKRKSAKARVRLYPKNPDKEIFINEKKVEDYFPYFEYQKKVKEPLKVTGTENLFKITVKVQGGGLAGQAEAVRHGISRALLKYDHDFRKALKARGYLTRDARVKERKKPGLKRARRAPQWQKR